MHMATRRFPHEWDSLARVCAWYLASAALLGALAAVSAARGEVRVQDIARLQGQRTNKLMGYGLVVGLNGTGDGEKYLPTMRALMRLHQRYHAPIIADADVKGNRSVALVVVEATIPEFGAREGQALDVTVAAIGAAKSLRGGQLLTTPLQYAMFDDKEPDTQHILALAGGKLLVPSDVEATRGTVPQGATLEEDFIYNFIEGGRITLVLDDTHAGWTWAHMVARALNHELANAAALQDPNVNSPVVSGTTAVALGPKNILVTVPAYELANPANFISRVLQTQLFMLPEQAARVTLNRTTKNISFTGTVTVSPTVLQLPGLGTVLIGKPDAAKDKNGVSQPVRFSELLDTLSSIKATPDQLMDAVEQLHKSGTLHAQLQYE
jgi:flagellar P-ring protein precursor FlgI